MSRRFQGIQATASCLVVSVSVNVSKRNLLTLRVLIQDKKQSDEKPRTAEMWPGELTKLFRGKISKLEYIYIGIHNTSSNSLHKIKNVIL